MKYLILVFVLFTFSTKGASIISTNQYNVPFINSKTLLISIDILTNLPQASCSGFSYIVSNVNNATNYQVFDMIGSGITEISYPENSKVIESD